MAAVDDTVINMPAAESRPSEDGPHDGEMLPPRPGEICPCCHVRKFMWPDIKSINPDTGHIGEANERG